MLNILRIEFPFKTILLCRVNCNLALYLIDKTIKGQLNTIFFLCLRHNRIINPGFFKAALYR